MSAFAGIILFFLIDLTVYIHSVNANECCATIPDSASGCKDLCRQISLSESQVDQISKLATAPSHCPDNLLEFWACAEKTLPVLLELGAFSGRPCCNLTKTKACREACVKAQSETDIQAHCSHSTEDPKLFECIDRQRDGEKCCGKTITTDSLQCKATCWNMYLTNSITNPDSKRNLRQRCTGRNKEVVQCLQKQTRSTRQSSNIESLHCCENTNNDTCRKVCTETLRSESNQDEKIEKIIEACGRVDLIDPLYQCLLKEGNDPPEPIAGLDSAKLHCCEKADTPSCGDLCVQTHTSEWSSIRKFEQNCGYLASPLSTHEEKMHSCLKDVEEPCQLGCSGLQYCTNMNNRPKEHFRSCTKEADAAARNDILTWQKGEIILPNLSIPVKDIRTCEPEMWKTIACAYQIKPCYKKPSPPQICREDCVYIMNKCVDLSHLHNQKVTDLCKRLHPMSSGLCIPVKQYIVESPHKGSQQEVSHPCKDDPCPEDEVCIIKRRKCRHSSTCPHHVCKKGCKLGQVSKVLVPTNTEAVIPVYKGKEPTSAACLDYKVCHCSHTGNLGHCRDVKCIPNKDCRISTGLIKSGEHFMSGCNDCVCHGGEEICSKRDCSATPEINKQEFTDLKDCRCSCKYDPVCASNGKTYPNPCVALCAGQTLYSQGTCNLHDACRNNPCEAGYRCVAHKQVCFGHRNSPCLQYKCVSLNECNEHHHEPVCDISGMEYTNDCLLLSHGKTIGYRGHCQVRPCSTRGVVCGHDGETYTSECEALAARTTIDYVGPCISFGFSAPDLGMHERPSMDLKCAGVECPAVLPLGCQGFVPPWSCCPVCAAELRILTSERMAHVSIEVKKGPVTVSKILETLSSLISLSECDVLGYLGLDDDIIVLVAPVTEKTTSLQVNACSKEAERLQYLINSRNPTVASDLTLTPLLYAKLRTPVMKLTSSASAFHTQQTRVILTLIVFNLLFFQRILGIL